MKRFLFLLILISSGAQAFTLNNNFGAAFKKSKVKVFVDDQTTCSRAGLTASDLAALVGPAVDDFWNGIPTSSLKLVAAGFTPTVSPDINEDRLCAPTDTTCINGAAPASLIPPVLDIVIACNRNNANFGGGSSVLAVTVPNNFAGRKIAGAVILINDAADTFANLSHSDKVSVIAHEIGHAIGLGHSKEDEALMYYKTVDLRTNLGQDDIDGVSYLYPTKPDACGLFTGTISGGASGSGPSMWQMALTFAILVLLFETKKLLKRPKTCSPA